MQHAADVAVERVAVAAARGIATPQDLAGLDRDLDDKTQPEVQQVWNNLPLERNQPLAASTPLDLSRLLPQDRSYFTYMGSLTEPPCTVGVLWMVMRQPVLLSRDQIAIFAKLHPMNARPIQPASGRWIKESR